MTIETVSPESVAIVVQNYVKAKRDYNEWQDDAKARNPVAAFPFSLPDGKAVADPGKYKRQYIYVVRGAPDSGKSYWRKSSLKPGTYFLVSFWCWNQKHRTIESFIYGSVFSVFFYLLLTDGTRSGRPSGPLLGP